MIGHYGGRVATAPPLPLTGRFLDALVGDEETRLPVAEHDAESIDVRKLTLELERNIRSGAAVRKVFFGRRVEVTTGVGHIPADADERA